MSEIKTKNQNFPVHDKNDVIALYEGTRTNPNFPDTNSKVGMEVELNLYNTDSLDTLNIAESRNLVKKGSCHGISINKEPSATTLEVLTEPHTRENFPHLLEEINERFTGLWDIGEARHILPSPFGYLPHVKPEDHHPTRNERYIAFWVPPRDDMVEAFHSFLDPSIQVSISYRDLEHLLRIIRLSIVLEPFLILTTETDAGFFEGQKVDGSPRTRILKRRGRNGGIPDFYFTAKSGEELIDNHIHYTLHNKHMFACFDAEGNLGKLPEGTWASFSQLEKRGFGPQDLLNYRQAQSESWRRTVNISEIRDNDDGTLFAHRAEISSLFCTGLQHQRATAGILSCLIAYCNHFYDHVKDLSKDFGIDMDNLSESQDLIDQNFENAYNHHGLYHGLPYGNGTLKDFALRFAEMSDVCLKGWKLDMYAAPLMHILNEGRPDWLVKRETFPTLEDQMDYMRRLPALAAEHPALISYNSCADFTKDLIKR